jgi:hypothetical protein
MASASQLTLEQNKNKLSDVHEGNMIDRPEAPDPYEVAAEEAIAACDGDIRAALKAALIAMVMLEADMRQIAHATSRGYSRSRLHGKGAA